MITPLNLSSLARRSRRNGWFLTVFCGISVLFSLSSPTGLLVCVAGIATGITEIVMGGKLAESDDPRRVLRLLGKVQIGFSAAMAIYFGTTIATYIVGKGIGGIISPSDAAMLESEMPGTLGMVTQVAILGTVFVAVIGIGWQLWTARRYLRDAENAVAVDKNPPIVSNAASASSITISLSPFERNTLRDLSTRKGLTEDQIVHEALYLIRERSDREANGEQIWWIPKSATPTPFATNRD